MIDFESGTKIHINGPPRRSVFAIPLPLAYHCLPHVHMNTAVASDSDNGVCIGRFKLLATRRQLCTMPETGSLF